MRFIISPKLFADFFVPMAGFMGNAPDGFGVNPNVSYSRKGVSLGTISGFA